MDAEALSQARAFALQNAEAHGGRASEGAVMGRLLGARPELRARAAEVGPEVARVVAEVNGMAAGDRAAELAASPPPPGRPPGRPGVPLPPLEGAEPGAVVTRFPPEPNGYPHIGHAKAAVINAEYARMYGGRVLLRMDDTNPEAERLEYYAAIKVGMDWLGIEFDRSKNTSDDIEMLLGKGRELVGSGGAYVCTCSRGDVSRGRREGRPCRCRGRGTEEAAERWDRMFGRYKPGQAIVRYMGDMSSQNTVMRDPTLFRIVEGRHPLLGARHDVWPSYDMAVCVEDSADGVTHAFRSKEYEMRAELYYSILDRLGMRKPRALVFSRLSLEGAPVSKSAIKPLVDEGAVSGYDDPRLPTLEGLRRRGVSPAAVRRFVLSLGLTKAESSAPFEALEAFNRTEVDPGSCRLFAARSPVRCSVEGLPAGPVRVPCHPSGGMGERELRPGRAVLLDASDAAGLGRGSRLRLLGLGDIEVEGAAGGLHARYAGDDASAGLPRVQWVPEEGALAVRLLVPRRLLDAEGRRAPDSLGEERCAVEPHYGALEDGAMAQFVRIGYCRRESRNVAIFSHR